MLAGFGLVASSSQTESTKLAGWVDFVCCNAFTIQWYSTVCFSKYLDLFQMLEEGHTLSTHTFRLS